jgi:GNAT superfamily N-acetyltransferase
MEPLTTRTATWDDVRAVNRLINQAFVAESPYVNGERINLEGVRELIAKGTFLLGEQDDELVACVYVEGRGHSAHIGLVSVDPGRQSAGFGTQIMSAVEAHCRTQGYREMELRFINHRTDLQRFYSNLGYAPTGLAESPDPSRMKVPFHFVQMTKSLL